MDEIIGEIKKKIKDHKIKLVRYLYVDLDNVIRGRISTAENIEEDIISGLTLAMIMQSGFSLTDLVVPTTSYGPVGEVRLVPDIKTFKILPYAENTAAMIVEQYAGDRPHEVDPRPKLKSLIEKSKYSFKVGIEPEFYILKDTGNSQIEFFDKHLCFSTHGMNSSDEIIKEVISALELQDIKIDHFYPEYGSSQFELSLKPSDPLGSADNLIYFRETLRALLFKRNLYASFMPKPSEKLPGTGLHLHLSLWKDGENITYSDKDKHNLSEEAYYFIGGVLKYLKEIIALTASSVNSYKRLKPNSWSSAFACWGPENREAAIRIPYPTKGKEKESMRFEFKFVDATSNPYLAIGSIIAAGLRGIESKLDPGEPCTENPASYPPHIREEKGWYRYPENLLDALRELDKSNLMRDVWGDKLIDEYIKLKKFQWDLYYDFVSEWERRHFLKLY